MLFGMPKLLKDWQVGDGREERVVAHVLAHALPGNVDDAIRVIDDFGWQTSVLINVGDKKGPILEKANYCAYMQAQEGRLWRTAEHSAPIEYQSVIQDLVLVSEYLGS